MNSDLLHKFFRGECSPKQAHEVLVWINSDEGKAEFEKAFDTFNFEEVPGDLDSQQLLTNIHRRLAEESLVNDVISQENGASFEVSQGGQSHNWKWIFRVAASILLLLMITWIAYFYRAGDLFPSGKPGQVEIISKHTEPGQKLTIHLADGSIAVLNASSSITYPKQFSDTLRSVSMEGEVFFEVTRNVKKPFVVSTTKIKTTVLGTSFNIKARNQQHQQVSLLTGKVRIDALDGNETDYLVPGEEIIWSENRLAKQHFDIKTKTLWKDGVIFFDNTPLSECFETLELWYGVTIEVAQPHQIGDKKVSGRFEKDYLGNVLNSISYAHEFEYEINKERVSVKFAR